MGHGEVAAAAHVLACLSPPVGVVPKGWEWDQQADLFLQPVLTDVTGGSSRPASPVQDAQNQPRAGGHL